MQQGRKITNMSPKLEDAEIKIVRDVLSRQAKQVILSSAVRAGPSFKVPPEDRRQAVQRPSSKAETQGWSPAAGRINHFCVPHEGRLSKVFPKQSLGTRLYNTGFHGDNEAIFDCLYQNDGGHARISYKRQLLQAPEKAAHLCPAAAAALGLVIRQHR